CGAELEQVTPFFASGGTLWHWHLKDSWLREQLNKARGFDQLGQSDNNTKPACASPLSSTHTPDRKEEPMRHDERKQPVTIVSGVVRSGGFPDFAITQGDVTQEELENGIHIYLAEADPLVAGYEEPFVHFPETESPAFLFPAV